MFFFILNHKISFLCYVASSQLFENHSQYIDIRIFLLPIIGVCHKNRLGSNKVFFCFKKKRDCIRASALEIQQKSLTSEQRLYQT